MPAAHRAPPVLRPARGPLRAWARPGIAKARIGRRLAAGLTPAQVARIENLPEAEVAALAADPDFAALVDECRALESQPEEEARRKLACLARFLLEDAVVMGDLRAVIFVLREENRGRDPARTLADRVLAVHRRAAASPPAAAEEPAPMPAPAPAAPCVPRPAVDPADRMAWHAATHFRAELRREVVALHRATATEAHESPAAATWVRPAPTPAQPAVATPERKPRNRRERRRLAALRRREGGGVTPPGRPRPPPAPRARAP